MPHINRPDRRYRHGARRPLLTFRAARPRIRRCCSVVMIAGYTAGPTTTLRCSRGPAMRAEFTIANAVGVRHGVPLTVGTPDSCNQVASERTDSPAS